MRGSVTVTLRCTALCLIGVTACSKDQPQTPLPPPSSVAHSPQVENPFQIAEAEVYVGSWRIDRSAYVGLSASSAEAATAYLRAALSALPKDAAPKRDVYQRVDLDAGPVYPMDVAWKRIGSESVPILLLPAAHQIRSTLSSPDLNLAFSGAPQVLGRTVLFQPGKSSEAPVHVPALPRGSAISAGVFKHQPPHLKLGKLVLKGRDADAPDREPLAPLRIGEKRGASLIAMLRTVPAFPQNPILRIAQIEMPNQPQRAWVSYAILDANGARRGTTSVLPSGESSFAKPFHSEIHDPHVGRHSLLRLPTPIRLGTNEGPYEEIALDEWFCTAKPAMFVVTLDPSSTPFRESFNLRHIEPDVPIDEPIWMVIVFSNIEPTDLIEGLRFLAPGSELKNEDSLLVQLQQLHKQVLTQ